MIAITAPTSISSGSASRPATNHRFTDRDGSTPSRSRIPIRKPSAVLPARRPILGERQDNELLESLSPPFPNKIRKPVASPQLRTALHGSIRSFSSIDSPTRSTPSPLRMSGSLASRHVYPDLSSSQTYQQSPTRFKFGTEDVTQLVSVAPPESLDGFTTESDDEGWQSIGNENAGRTPMPPRKSLEVKGRAIRAQGLMTPSNSQDLQTVSRTTGQKLIMQKPISQASGLYIPPNNRLPTPATSQVPSSTPQRPSPPNRIRARPSPTPPRRTSAGPSQIFASIDPSPNPRAKKNPRFTALTHLEQASTPKSHTAGAVSSAQRSLSSKLDSRSGRKTHSADPPSTVPPRRRSPATTQRKPPSSKARDSSGRMSVTVKRPRKSAPIVSSLFVGSGRSRRSLTPQALSKIAGRPLEIGIGDKEVEGSPGDDPLLLKPESDDECVGRPVIRAAMGIRTEPAANRKGKGRASGLGLDFAKVKPPATAGPSRISTSFPFLPYTDEPPLPRTMPRWVPRSRKKQSLSNQLHVVARSEGLLADSQPPELDESTVEDGSFDKGDDSLVDYGYGGFGSDADTDVNSDDGFYDRSMAEDTFMNVLARGKERYGRKPIPFDLDERGSTPRAESPPTVDESSVNTSAAETQIHLPSPTPSPSPSSAMTLAPDSPAAGESAPSSRPGTEREPVPVLRLDAKSPSSFDSRDDTISQLSLAPRETISIVPEREDEAQTDPFIAPPRQAEIEAMTVLRSDVADNSIDLAGPASLAITCKRPVATFEELARSSISSSSFAESEGDVTADAADLAWESDEEEPSHALLGNETQTGVEDEQQEVEIGTYPQQSEEASRPFVHGDLEEGEGNVTAVSAELAWESNVAQHDPSSSVNSSVEFDEPEGNVTAEAAELAWKVDAAERDRSSIADVMPHEVQDGQLQAKNESFTEVIPTHNKWDTDTRIDTAAQESLDPGYNETAWTCKVDSGLAAAPAGLLRQVEEAAVGQESVDQESVLRPSASYQPQQTHLISEATMSIESSHHVEISSSAPSVVLNPNHPDLGADAISHNQEQPETLDLGSRTPARPDAPESATQGAKIVLKLVRRGFIKLEPADEAEVEAASIGTDAGPGFNAVESEDPELSESVEDGREGAEQTDEDLASGETHLEKDRRSVAGNETREEEVAAPVVELLSSNLAAETSETRGETEDRTRNEAATEAEGIEDEVKEDSCVKPKDLTPVRTATYNELTSSSIARWEQEDSRDDDWPEEDETAEVAQVDDQAGGSVDWDGTIVDHAGPGENSQTIASLSGTRSTTPPNSPPLRSHFDQLPSRYTEAHISPAPPSPTPIVASTSRAQVNTSLQKLSFHASSNEASEHSRLRQQVLDSPDRTPDRPSGSNSRQTAELVAETRLSVQASPQIEEGISIRSAGKSLLQELAQSGGRSGAKALRGVVEVSSLDPRAAARAAAILKLNHNYIEHGILPSEPSAEASTSAFLAATPSRSPGKSRRKSYTSRHFDSVEASRLLTKEELLNEAELEIVVNEATPGRGQREGTAFSAVSRVSGVTDLPVPGAWVRTPKRRLLDLPGTRSVSIPDVDVPSQDKGPAWGVAEWKRLERVYREEKQAWIKERETKRLPGGLMGWARRSSRIGTPRVEATPWDDQRVVYKFLVVEGGRKGKDWEESVILLRVKALERRVNEKISFGTDGGSESPTKRKKVDGLTTPARNSLSSTATPTGLAPPSTIKRVMTWVWGSAKSASARPAIMTDASDTSTVLDQSSFYGDPTNRRKAETIVPMTMPSTTAPLMRQLPLKPVTFKENPRAAPPPRRDPRPRLSGTNLIANQTNLDLSTATTATAASLPLNTPHCRQHVYPSISQRSAAIKSLFPDSHPLGDSTASTISAASGDTSFQSEGGAVAARTISGLRKQSSVKDMAKLLEEKGILSEAMAKKGQ